MYTVCVPLISYGIRLTKYKLNRFEELLYNTFMTYNDTRIQWVIKCRNAGLTIELLRKSIATIG